MQTIAYNTSKGAVVNFTRALAGSWGRYGITVNALAPGFFPSKMTKGIIDMVGVEKLAEGAPLRRIGDEDDLKGAALLFASDAGKHITVDSVGGRRFWYIERTPHVASPHAGFRSEAIERGNGDRLTRS